MNSIVQSPEESDFPRMHLAVVDDGEYHIESPYLYSQEELHIEFLNPYNAGVDEIVDDLQYVMEVEGPAEFIDGGSIGCEGNRRLAARHLDSSKVLLKVHDPSATIKLWAGWATGQNTVRLTPDLILEPQEVNKQVDAATAREAKSGIERDEKAILVDENPLDEEVVSEPGNPIANEEAGEILLDQEEDHHESYPSGKGEGKEKSKRMPKGYPGDASKKEEAKLLGHMKETPQQQHPKHALKLEREERQQEIDNLKEKIKDMHPLQQAKHVHNTVKDMHSKFKDKYGGVLDMKTNKSFREKYESDSFADRLDMQRHIIACFFFVIAMGYIVFFHGRRRGVKGRRDL